MQVSNQHLLHAAELKVELDGAERAEDNALHPLEVQYQAQRIEQSVNIVQGLFHFLDEEDDVLIQRKMELGSGYGSIA